MGEVVGVWLGYLYLSGVERRPDSVSIDLVNNNNSRESSPVDFPREINETHHIKTTWRIRACALWIREATAHTCTGAHGNFLSWSVCWGGWGDESFFSLTFKRQMSTLRSDFLNPLSWLKSAARPPKPQKDPSAGVRDLPVVLHPPSTARSSAIAAIRCDSRGRPRVALRALECKLPFVIAPSDLSTK